MLAKISKPSFIAIFASPVLLWSTCIAASAGVPQPTATAKPAPPSVARKAPASEWGDLGSWERRLLGQDYDHDPLDKRIQRLELLLFGGTRDGSLSERLDDIRAAISARQAVKPSKATVSDILNQLEQRVLKKTFRTEATETRLVRLETKLFGKPSPSMTAPERIDRLKRTIGIGEPPPIAQFPGGNDFGNMPYTHSFGSTIVIPFGNGGNGSTNPGDVTRQMDEMFKQLNRQMRHLNQVPRIPGGQMPSMPLFPSMPDFPDELLNPNGGSEQQVPPTFVHPRIRQPRERTNENALPPYADPNSI